MSEAKEREIAQKNVGDVDSTERSDGEIDREGRESWTRPIDFVLACIGFSVGLGNVWRFPYLCYKNGGGAFLIPYFLFVIVGGVPLFFLEVAVGQFMSEGGIGAWRICPIFQGIGVATTIIVFFLNCYYNVILAWAFYYFFSSFTDVVPWNTCDNWWNTPRCTTEFNTNGTYNVTLFNGTHHVPLKPIDAVTEFWENKVLGIDQVDGIDDVGTIKWDLALTLLFAWIVVYACICQGIKSSGKVMYVTATSPYIFMTILLVRGVTLDGAVDGIIFYLNPDFDKLLNIQVWVDAGTQIFFSYSISLGALTALGSFNKFRHNSYRDSIIFALFNSGTSFFAGFVIMSTLGYMAKQQNVSVADVAKSGPGLAFIAYPKALAEMPVAPLWSVFFFLMIILLGLDSQFVGVEGFVTAISDVVPSLKGKYRKPIFIGFCCMLKFFIGLSMCTHGGMFVFQLFDYYSGSRIILFVAFFECIAVAWLYGVNRFYDNLEMMYGFRINPFMKFSWTVTAPIFCIAVFILSTIEYSELTYDTSTRGLYVYPDWAVGVGWGLAGLSAIWIPIVMIYKLVTHSACGKCLRSVIQPEGLNPHQLRPEDFDDLPDSETNGTPPPNYMMENPGFEASEAQTSM